MSKQSTTQIPVKFLALRRLLVILLVFTCDPLLIAGTVSELPGETSAGKEVYNYYCYQCHAYSGDARTLASTYQHPPPRNFTKADLRTLTRESMLQAVSHGRPGTAMVSFATVLGKHEIEAVVDYIRANLMSNNPRTQRYHTNENGWPRHERYAIAFPFVTGEISLDSPWNELDKQEYAGKLLYLNACITCHDHGPTQSSEPIWEIRAVSYPREHYSHKLEHLDALSGASTHLLHEKAIPETGMSGREKQGRQLYLDNCAFCHAPDGSAKNWIGSFLDQGPKNFTADDYIDKASDDYLQNVILEGLPGTSMPAWKQVLTKAQVDEIIVFLRRAFGSHQQAVE